jgi:hypothetical protein
MAGSTAQDKRQQRQKAQLKRFLAAAQHHLVPDAQYRIGMSFYTGAELVAQLQARLQPHLDLDAVVAETRAKTGQARANVRKTLPDTGDFLSRMSSSLRASFPNPAVRKDFGVPTGLRREPSVLTKAEAAGSRLLTRQERHTMGKRQRQRIRGGKAVATLLGPDGKPIGKKGGK